MTKNSGSAFGAFGACCGCCVSPYWNPPLECYKMPEIDFPKIDLLSGIKLSPIEEEVLKKLVEAYNLYMSLDKRSEMDNQEYTDAIHRAQQLIALRVARRVNPEVWKQPE